MKSWLRRNWFLSALGAAVGLAFIWPEAGAADGWLRTGITTRIAVILLFFIRGLLLPWSELKTGMMQWRLHGMTHAMIFLVAPLLVLGGLSGIGWFFELDSHLRTGFFLLAVMPTTIATAAAFTALAGGNTAAAVFNATVSNLLGVVLAPLWMGWFLSRSTEPFSAGPVMVQVALLVVVPLLLGLLFKPLLPSLSVSWNKRLEITGGCLVLFVLFAAFSNSVRSGLFQVHGPGVLAGVVLAAALLFAMMTLLTVWVGRWARFDRPDAICLLFCGSQKTLAAGVPLANLMFPGDPALSLILLPLVFYHFIQLFMGGLLVDQQRGA